MTRLRFLRSFLSLAPALPALLFLAGCDTASTGEDANVEPRMGRGATISETTLFERSAAQLNADFAAAGLPLSARFDVTAYKVVYETIDPQGGVTQASGALFVPRNAPGARPLASYQHGTLTRKDEAPSAGGGEQLIGLILAADGYVAALPDLLGLGDSPGLHPYVHAAASASAAIDMLRAATDFAAAHEIDLSGQLFLTGYSQGGYTAMAAHRELEANHRDEFQLTASAPMAGPYDLSGVMAATFTERKTHPSPFYLPYTVLAYNDVYGLFDSPSEMFAAPYDALLPPLFDGTHGGGEINDVMPEIPIDIFTPAFVAAFQDDSNHPLRLRLRENDVYDWTPQAPMQLYHCAQDQHVPPENTQVALQRFQQRGAAKVEFIDPLPTGGHGACVGPSLLFAKFWFDSFVAGAAKRAPAFDAAAVGQAFQAWMGN